MPQTVTFSIAAKFDKGPDLKSEAKVDVGSYAGLLEEMVCKCTSKTFYLPAIAHDKIEALIITADKYKTEKECPPQNGSAVCVKRVWYGFGNTNKALTRPTILCSDDLKDISFKNEMTEDVKVSVLAILKADCPPAKDAAAEAACCGADKK